MVGMIMQILYMVMILNKNNRHMDKGILQKLFSQYLTEQNKYPLEHIKLNYKIQQQDGIVILVDVAIVINDIVIQAFMLSSKGDSACSSNIEYSQLIDSVPITSMVELATYDESTEKWILDSRDEISSSPNACFLSYSKTGYDFVKKAKAQIQAKRQEQNINMLSDTCKIARNIGIVYLVIYVLLEVLASCNLCDYQLPLSWELIVMVAIILILSLLPILLPFMSKIQIGSVQLDLMIKEFNTHL